jgi:acetyltransferase-like isoleucine patch superfamily enzyme
VIGDFVTLAPGVRVGGYASIGDACWIGISATIIDRVSIGGSFVGAGAVITKDIPDNVLAAVVSAKPIRKVSESEWRRPI